MFVCLYHCHQQHPIGEGPGACDGGRGHEYAEGFACSPTLPVFKLLLEKLRQTGDGVRAAGVSEKPEVEQVKMSASSRVPLMHAPPAKICRP